MKLCSSDRCDELYSYFKYFFQKLFSNLICSWNQTGCILEIKLRTSFSIFLSKKYLLVTLTICLKMNILLMILDINKKHILPNISNNVGGNKITLCLAFTCFRVKVFFCVVCGTGFLCMLIVSWYFFFPYVWSHHFSFLSSVPCIILIGGASERPYQMLFIMKLFSEITLFSRHNPSLASSWYHLGIKLSQNIILGTLLNLCTDYQYLPLNLILKCQVQVSLIFGKKLLLLRWTKWKPLFLKPSYLFRHCRVSWWTGSRFKLILPESNKNNWESGCKSLYLSVEIE